MGPEKIEINPCMLEVTEPVAELEMLEAIIEQNGKVLEMNKMVAETLNIRLRLLGYYEAPIAEEQ